MLGLSDEGLVFSKRELEVWSCLPLSWHFPKYVVCCTLGAWYTKTQRGSSAYGKRCGVSFGVGDLIERGGRQKGRRLQPAPSLGRPPCCLSDAREVIDAAFSLA